MRTGSTTHAFRSSTGTSRSGVSGTRRLAWIGVLAATFGCSRGSPSPPASADVGTSPPPAAPDAPSPPAADTGPDSGGIATPASDVSVVADVAGDDETVAPIAEPVPSAPRPPGSMADLDPTNDAVTGPPDPLPDCEARSTPPASAGLRRPSGSPPAQRRRLRGRTGSTYREGRDPLSLSSRLRPRPGAGPLEAIAGGGRRFLGSRITQHRAGHHRHRRIARFPGMMSEHSYANGIDVRSFKLADSRTVTVLRHFGATTRPRPRALPAPGSPHLRRGRVLGRPHHLLGPPSRRPLTSTCPLSSTARDSRDGRPARRLPLRPRRVHSSGVTGISTPRTGFRRSAASGE